MICGTILKATSVLRGYFQTRGMAAVKNYKRPSMDELGVPSESWNILHARTQKKYNGALAGGLILFLATMVYCWQSDVMVFRTIPRHLIEERYDFPKNKQ